MDNNRRGLCLSALLSCLTRLATSLFALACLAHLAILGRLIGAENAIDIQRQVSITMIDQNIMQTLVRLGSQESIPIGIVLDKTNALCNQRKSVTAVNRALGQVMTDLLAASGEVWSVEDGVIEVKPKQVSEASVHILNMTFSEYRSMDTTIQGLGIILSGNIYSRVNPRQGYAGNILSSLDAEKVPAFRLQNVSVKQIANHIISLGNKGMWIFYPQPEDAQQNIAQHVQLSTYGYKDDKRVLETVSCSKQ